MAEKKYSEEQEFVRDYFSSMRKLLQVDDAVLGNICSIAQLWREAVESGGRVILMGNGGSAAIADHIAVDLSKNAGLPATSFSSVPLVTCLANDYGYEYWMQHALRLNATSNDVLTIISSSGTSPNILAAIEQAKKMNIKVVTLSGFSSDNPMRAMGDVNLWLDCAAYNIVETVHQAWLVCVVDLLIGATEYQASRIADRYALS